MAAVAGCRCAMKRNAIIVLSLAVIIAIIALIIASRGRVKICDSRFQVISVITSRATNQTFYFGNQLAGQLKDKLIGLGMHIKPVTKVPARSNGKTLVWVCVVYRGEFQKTDLAGVQGDLINSEGDVFPLDGQGNPDPVSGDYMIVWLENLSNKRKLNYRLRLKLPKDGARLAEINVGAL